MLGLISNRPRRDRHTNAESEDQLPALNDITQEILTAENTGASHQALILSSMRSVRPSKDERVLASGSGPSTTFPAQAGIQSARNARTPCMLTLSLRAKAPCTTDPEPGGCIHRHHTQFLGSRFRENDNPIVHLKSA